MEFEDILQQIGGYGTFQKKITLFFAVPVYIIVPWFWLNKMFIISVPDHWCYVPELDSYNMSDEDKRNLISPLSDSSCSMYKVNYTDLLTGGFTKVPNGSETIPCTSGWRYDSKYYDHTAATKWDMVCEHDYLPSLVLTIYSIGHLLGSPINGFLSDKFGRKVVFFSLAAMVVVTDVLSSQMSNLVGFAILRLINGLALPSMFVLPYILINELVVPEMRVNINGIFNTCWTVGLSLLPLIAYFLRDWTFLCYLNAGSAFFILLFVGYVPESPCWLVSQGRIDDALKIMLRIAKENGKEQNENELRSYLQKLKEKGEDIKESEDSNSENFILKYPRIRTNFCIIAFCWATFNMAYSGMTYNTANLSGNEFVNYFLMGVVELPANVLYWYAMDKWGRRWTASVGFLMTAAICLLPIIGFNNSGIICSLIAKFLIAGVVMVSDQQAMELFPTVCRSFGLGAGKTISSVIGLIVPFIAYLDTYGKYLPFVIISGTCFAACILTSFLPETLNAYLPQTVRDAEVFGKDQQFFSWIRGSSVENSKQVSTIEDKKNMTQINTP